MSDSLKNAGKLFTDLAYRFWGVQYYQGTGKVLKGKNKTPMFGISFAVEDYN